MGEDINQLAAKIETLWPNEGSAPLRTQAPISETGRTTKVNGHDAHSSYRQSLLGLEQLQERLRDAPYSIEVRIKLARAYKLLGYPDLAVGEAYKALLLIDEVLEEGGEYHEEALDAAILTIKSLVRTGVDRNSAHVGDHENGLASTDVESLGDSVVTDEEVEVWAKDHWSRAIYSILVECLLLCGCLKSASNYCSMALKAFPDDKDILALQEDLAQNVSSYIISKKLDTDKTTKEDYPERGLVRRELYPWNDHEPDRYSPGSLDFLNQEMTKVAPKLEVLAVKLPILSVPVASLKGEVLSEAATEVDLQLGIFAKEDILAGEVVLSEKSMVTGITRLHDSFCDACSMRLPKITTSILEVGSPSVLESSICCEECDDVFFCSQECHDLAQETYHPALCGAVVDIISKTIPATEAADFLYSLLLLRILAMAETQDIHPLDVKEIKYIWGDYHGLPLDHLYRTSQSNELLDTFGGAPQALPFSFEMNVLNPLHLLEKMDVNIFTQSPRYDTWVINTLYAKFRGTASARQALDGKPETGAVHPMWCLANHSCDPNVTWECDGTIKFRTKEERMAWKGKESRQATGIKKGEELFSHYCDVRLPVGERREWAAGALGGDCRCERCVWEAGERKHGDEGEHTSD